jgi:leader peptidase (prepilin peptidase)/N-methyltransferase
MTACVDLVLAGTVNFALLTIASCEFRRHRITAHIWSSSPIIVLSMWTVAEVAAGGRYSGMPLTYAALMGSIGIGVVTDRAAGYILDVVTLPSCAFALIAETSAARTVDSITGILAVSGTMLILYAVSRGNGLGLGDVKLAAAAGALLGAQAGLISLAVSFVLGGGVAALLIVRGFASRKTAVPFAPYIAAGALTVLTFAKA